MHSSSTPTDSAAGVAAFTPSSNGLPAAEQNKVVTLGQQPAPSKAMATPTLPPRNAARASGSGSSVSKAAGSSSSDAAATPAASSNGSSSNRGPMLVRPNSSGKLTAGNAGAAAGPRGMPALPARAAGSAGPASSSGPVVGVIDPEESEATQKLRANVHSIRVRLIRAASRLGYAHDNGLVKQVLYRLYLAEKLKEPFRKGARRPDAAWLAAKEAAQLEKAEGPHTSLSLNVKILVIGLRGTGKTQLIRSLLAMGGSSSSSSSSSSAASLPLDAFAGATKRVEVSQGQVLGITLTLIDTPGLTASAAGAAANAAVLRKLRKAFQQHEPDLVLYVDRFDQPSRAGGEVPVLQAVTNACGPHIWLNTIVALTHAGAMPPASGQGSLSWDAYSQQRSQLLQLIIRSASGDARLMNPIAFAESHPGCRRNAQGQAVIPSGMAWQQHMLVLVMSAKLLADAEAALQMTPDAAGAGGQTIPDTCCNTKKSTV
ncbi:hypothetical protein COO60DRAFT_810164 [Scenedesmus sp. NREL 46B-D3]|nr:hypothetical protein COO60DRAFT_810164 [Scenedesmus sp. NREL 46B-D3]